MPEFKQPSFMFPTTKCGHLDIVEKFIHTKVNSLLACDAHTGKPMATVYHCYQWSTCLVGLSTKASDLAASLLIAMSSQAVNQSC